MRKLIFYLKQLSIAESLKVLCIVAIARFNDLFSKNFYEIWKVLKFLWDKGFQIERKSDQNIINFVVNEKNVKLALRRSSSDFAVFDQVFVEGEYAPLLFLVENHKIQIRSIVDLGANIGFATIFLKSHFTTAKIFSIEPYAPNFEMLKKNVEMNNFQEITFIQKAIWSHDTPVTIVRDWCDGRDWAVQVSESKKSKEEVSAISLTTLIDENNLTGIDLLKIDIEGAELNLFKNDLRLPSILKSKVKIIAMELHGSMEERYFITSLLIQNSFDCYFLGETIFGINKKLCG